MQWRGRPADQAARGSPPPIPSCAIIPHTPAARGCPLSFRDLTRGRAGCQRPRSRTTAPRRAAHWPPGRPRPPVLDGLHGSAVTPTIAIQANWFMLVGSDIA